MASYDTLWITDLNSDNPDLDVLFYNSITTISKNRSQQEFDKVKAHILTELEKHPHFKQLFLNRLIFSLANYLEHEKTENWRKKSAENNVVVQSKQKHIKAVEELLAWTKSLQTPTLIIDLVNDKKESENPYPAVFKNNYAYRLFIELKEATIKSKTDVAGYSFIFHKMKASGLSAINPIITEPAFIKFLNSHFDADISGIKLPYRNPTNKLQLYNVVLNKYKEDILK